MQRCANPMRRVSVNPPRHVRRLCSLAPLRPSSQGRVTTTFRFWRTSSRPRRASANARTPPRRAKCGVGRLSGYRGARRTLVADCAAVFARLRPPNQHAAIPIDLDGLCAPQGELAITTSCPLVLSPSIVVVGVPCSTSVFSPSKKKRGASIACCTSMP